jgi:cobalt-zinc-cadmium efflux system protein
VSQVDEPYHAGHGHGARRDAHGDHDREHHAHGHGHGHAGHGRSAPTRVLVSALALTSAYMVVEAAVGFWSGGLALLADAAHMLADAGALGLALFASVWAERPRTPQSTFGHRRAEVLAAFVNGIALGVTAIWIVVEAVDRWRSPREIRAGAMLAAAATGLVVNLVVAWILAAGRKDSLNVRAAFAHVAMDAVGSLAAVTSALLILVWRLQRADSLLSVGIAGIVAYSGWRVLRETTAILLEAAPAHLDVKDVERAILTCPGVSEVHDLHVWRISEQFDALTVHVTLSPGAHGVEVARDVALLLKNQFGLEHVTVQPEAPPPGEFVPLRLNRDGRKPRVG